MPRCQRLMDFNWQRANKWAWEKVFSSRAHESPWHYLPSIFGTTKSCVDIPTHLQIFKSHHYCPKTIFQDGKSYASLLNAILFEKQFGFFVTKLWNATSKLPWKPHTIYNSPLACVGILLIISFWSASCQNTWC
jgi:hypothetical protein